LNDAVSTAMDEAGRELKIKRGVWSDEGSVCRQMAG
jgi:hypothetical protein